MTIPAGSATATLLVSTSNDSVDETDSVITAELIDETAYDLGTSGSATVTVNDNDSTVVPSRPDVSISAGTSPVTEGTAATFTVSRTGATTTNLSVTVSVSETGAMISGTAPTSVRIPSGSATATLLVNTSNDSVDETDSVITAELVDETAYDLGTSESATVTVNDNDSTVVPSRPDVSISAGTSPVTEGTAATFTVSRTGATTTNLSVTVSVSETGAMISGTAPTSVRIPSGSATATLLVSTSNDSVDETDSVITAELIDETAYDLGTSESATVTVTDNDLPTVSIAALSTAPVEEGVAALFWVSRDGDTTDSLTVSVSVAIVGQVISGMAPISVTIAAGSERSLLAILTDDDDLDEAGGTITVALVAGDDYQLSSTAGELSASISVSDNDKPRVSIRASSDLSIDEGGSPSFTLSRIGDTTRSLAVNILVSDPGNVISGAVPAMVTIAAGAASEVLSIATEDDEADNDDSEIAVSIVATSADPYRAGSPASASVTVTDNDTALTLRIAARRLSDGRAEVALQLQGAGGTWGERVLPSSRFLAADAAVEVWRSSSAETFIAAGTNHAAEVRAVIRRLSDGRLEVALQQRLNGQWGDRVLPRLRIVSTTAEDDRWLGSSPVSVIASSMDSDFATAAVVDPADGSLLDSGPIPPASATESDDPGTDPLME